jgi:hypothetical protein
MILDVRRGSRVWHWHIGGRDRRLVRLAWTCDLTRPEGACCHERWR